MEKFTSREFPGVCVVLYERKLIFSKQKVLRDSFSKFSVHHVHT